MAWVAVAAAIAAILCVVDAVRVRKVGIVIIRSLCALCLGWIAVLYFHGAIGVHMRFVNFDLGAQTALIALPLLISAEIISRWNKRGSNKQ